MYKFYVISIINKDYLEKQYFETYVEAVEYAHETQGNVRQVRDE